MSTWHLSGYRRSIAARAPRRRSLTLWKLHAKGDEFSACQFETFREVCVIGGRTCDGDAIKGVVGCCGVDRGEVVGEQGVDAGDPPGSGGGVAGGLSLK